MTGLSPLHIAVRWIWSSIVNYSGTETDNSEIGCKAQD